MRRLFGKSGDSGGNNKVAIGIGFFALIGAIGGKFLAQSVGLKMQALIMFVIALFFLCVFYGLILPIGLITFYCKCRFESFNPLE
ncbi:MAG: hypothetical protein ACE3JK_03635 [Sporolactobacillus sp.]